MSSTSREGAVSGEPVVQPSVVYEIEQGPGSKPKNGRPPFPWWCDLFGPYEVIEKGSTTNRNGHETDVVAFADTIIRGIGAFTLVSVFDHGGGRFMSQCLWGARAAYIKQLPHPCPVRLEHHRDGTVITRQGIHNHGPEPEAPSPLSGRMPPLPEVVPTFEEVYATIQPFKKQFRREFKTYVTVLDEDTNQFVQMPITTENIRKVFDSHQQVMVDGKLRYCCPVDDCGSQMLGKWNLFSHMQLHHLPEGQRIHEFASADDFWKWKVRTETEEMSTFSRHKQSKLHEIEGIYQCFLGRRAAFERKCEGEAKPRKKARLLNHFCPAIMDVKLVDGRDNTRGGSGRIHVKFYRTHIGHTPSPLDVKMTEEDSQWLREQLEAGKDPQDIMAEVARNFDGRGPLRRLHVLDLGDIARTAFRYGLRNPEIRRAYEWWRTVDFSRDLNLARRRLVEVIRAKLNREEHPVVKKTEKHQWAESRIKQVLELNGVCHVREGDEVHVVYPRKSNHSSCEETCVSCDVCVHRYGCTCVSHVIDGQMCQHIHAVALRKGPPGVMFVSERPIDSEEKFNPEREIRALGRINYNQRVQDILLTLVPRMIQALQGDHFVDLERVAQLIENATEVLEATGPVPNIHVEENVPKPLPLDEFRGFVSKIRSAAEDHDGIADIAVEGDLINKEVQVNPADIEKEYADLEEEETYFERLMLSVNKRNKKTKRTPKAVFKAQRNTNKKRKPTKAQTKSPLKAPLNSITKRRPGRPKKTNLPAEQSSEKIVSAPNRRSNRISEKRALALKNAIPLSSKRRKTVDSSVANENLKDAVTLKQNGCRTINLADDTIEIKVETDTIEKTPQIVVLPYQDGVTPARPLAGKGRASKAGIDETQTVHEFVITPATKRSRTPGGSRNSAHVVEPSLVETVVVEVSPAEPGISTTSSEPAAVSKLPSSGKSQSTLAVQGCLHDHIYL
ncbi:uncharacterized protein LOC111246040 isoform X2 [Varroa destructor]|uniref:SWIM-type domain-containing protein n=1 Tax=Varroa destructor TaxID=109461 RepID=A0A7M7JER3_VARDE|nr:uncharacterized protein LOC111246040 isoform X2 [Varroa destructor]